MQNLKQNIRRAGKALLFLMVGFAAICIICTIIYWPGTHEHDWTAATCTEPKTCKGCGEIEGEAAGHDWVTATCIEPKNCAVCGKTEGRKADHTYTSATCTEEERCSVCGHTPFFSAPLMHDWTEATCTMPKTCARCGETEGEPRGHYCVSYGWTTAREPTCTDEGEETGDCYNCGEPMTRAIETVDHKAGEWQTTKQASEGVPGIRVKNCVWCGEELERAEYRTSQAPTGGTATDTGGGGGGNGSNFNRYDNEEQQNTEATYVLNKSTRVFHYPSCNDVKKIAPQNYATTNETREVIASLYKACGHCHP